MRPKGIIIFTIILFVIALAVFVYLKTNKIAPSANKETAQVKKNVPSADELVVAPQTPNGKVSVASVTLHKKGYLVAREMEGDKLSQIIEISKPLDIGTHKNVMISFDGAQIKGSDIIVMIYDDYGNDGIFNDFDQPALNESGNMTASYVKTGKPLPTSITESDSSAMSGMNMPGMKTMVKVRYTDQGFVPNKIEVTVGSMVAFVNESNKEMWVASAPHPAHTDLPTFDQFRPFKKGATYRYVFDKKGTWGFHDHLDPGKDGTVIVK